MHTSYQVLVTSYRSLVTRYKVLRNSSLVTVLVLCVGCSTTTPLPNTDIYVADFDQSTMKVSNVRNITQRTGYDNQPAFTLDGKGMYYVSDSTGVTDIYRYDLASGAIRQVTETNEQEFSPTPMNDGKSLSVVRVGKPLADGDEYTESQQVWRYDLGGRPIAPILATRRVGYHCWIDEGLIALFIVGDEEKGLPHKLIAADLASRQTIELATNIGRTLRVTSDGRLAFVDKSDSTRWKIATISQGEETATPLIALPKGSEDFCLLPDGKVVSISGNSLVMWKNGATPAFMPFHTFSDLNGTIARITTNADATRIVFVVTSY